MIIFSKKTLLCLLVLGTLPLISCLFYNQIKEGFSPPVVSAQTKGCSIDDPENRDKIPIGESIDQTEAFARRLLEDVQIIFNSSLVAIDSAESLTELTDEDHCTVNNCSSQMEERWDGCCDPYCCGCNPCEPPPEPEEETFKWFLEPEVVYAQDCTDLDCSCPEGWSGGGCSDWCCCWNYCDWCECKCIGDACPFGEINNSFQTIKGEVEKINTAFTDLKDLIEERVPDELKKSKILEKLIESRNKLDYCYTPVKKYEEVFVGEFTPKLVFSCEFTLDNYLLDNCYGHDPDEYQDRANNYFCCE